MVVGNVVVASVLNNGEGKTAGGANDSVGYSLLIQTYVDAGPYQRHASLLKIE